MLQLLEESKDDLVAMSLSGPVDRRDYDKMLPTLEAKIKQYGKINLYAEVHQVEAYTLRALWEDLKFDVRHLTDFRKVAIVGDKKWMDWVTSMASAFTTAKLKYFEPGQKIQAMNWLRHDES